MPHRSLTALGVAVLIAIASSMWGPISAQAPSTSVGTGGTEGWSLARHQELVRTIRSQIGVPENWTPPRTAWGEPDLQGSWTSDSVHGVPRERPEHFGTRAFLNDEEYAERGQKLHRADPAAESHTRSCHEISSTTQQMYSCL